MRAVRTRRTEFEDRLSVALKQSGLRFRRNDRRVFGTPDFLFKDLRLALFVDGDFWHGRAWFDKGIAPATNALFWIKKFERNRDRDRVVDQKLRHNGWSVMRVWGTDVRKNALEVAGRVRTRLRRLRAAMQRAHNEASTKHSARGVRRTATHANTRRTRGARE